MIVVGGGESEEGRPTLEGRPAAGAVHTARRSSKSKLRPMRQKFRICRHRSPSIGRQILFLLLLVMDRPTEASYTFRSSGVVSRLPLLPASFVTVTPARLLSVELSCSAVASLNGHRTALHYSLTRSIALLSSPTTHVLPVLLLLPVVNS